MQISSNFNLPPRNVDPDTYAQQYATKNNISLDKAKEELKSKYGDPQAPDESTSTANNIPSASSDSFDFSFEELDDKSSSNNSFEALINRFLEKFKGKSQIAKSSKASADFKQDPDAYAQEYATKHNITLEEAKEELAKLYGNPEQK